jgi:glucosylceramidase
MITAAQNPDGSIAVVILNMNSVSKSMRLSLGDRSVEVQISAQAIQTIMVLL